MGLLENIKELEEIGELEEIDELEELNEIDDKSALLDLFSNEIAKFGKTAFPVLLLSKNLKSFWVNSSNTAYFENKDGVINRYLHQVFSPYLTEERMQEIYDSLFSKKSGYSWRGRVELSGKHRITAISNLIISPFFDHTGRTEEPEGYIAFIDDITEDNNLLLRKIFESLLEASKLKDDDTGNHIERVNQYSQKIANTLFNTPGYEEIDKDFLLNIGFLAAMHDVGKIGTPDDILNKPGELTESEWAIMREHPKNGAYIMSSYPDKMAREITLGHHEKWDGSGYPYGFEKKDIPLSARIVAIADVYDALRMKRVYKEAFSHEKAFSIIIEGKNHHFDPDIIDIIKNVHDEFNNIYTRLADK